MSKRKLCRATLILADKRAEHLPVGTYAVAVTDTWIQDGSLKFSGTVIASTLINIVDAEPLTIDLKGGLMNCTKDMKEKGGSNEPEQRRHPENI